MISCKQPFSEEQHSGVCIYCSIPKSAGLYPDRWFPDGKQPRILANKDIKKYKFFQFRVYFRTRKNKSAIIFGICLKLALITIFWLS
jgi:hypothetical protein